MFYNITSAIASVAFPYLNSEYSMNFLFWMIGLSNLLSLFGLVGVYFLSIALPAETLQSESFWNIIYVKLRKFKTTTTSNNIVATTILDFKIWRLELYSFIYETKNSILTIFSLAREQPLTFWVFLIYMFNAYGCSITPLTYVPNYFIEAGYSESEGSLFSYFVINIISLVVSPLFGYMFDNFGKRFILPFILFCLQILSILILDKTNAHPIIFALLYVSAFAIIRIFGFPLLPLIVKENFIDYSATLFMVFCGCGSTSFYIITGSILKQYGYASLWGFCYGASCFTIILLSFVYLSDQYSDKRGELNENIQRTRLFLKTHHRY